VILEGAVREVEAKIGHARLDELDEALFAVRRWAERREDLRERLRDAHRSGFRDGTALGGGVCGILEGIHR